MKSQTVLGWGSWISVFAIAWLLILKIISATPSTWGFWIFFLLVALFSSVYDRDHVKVKRHDGR
jgi:hypothetical protein